MYVLHWNFRSFRVLSDFTGARFYKHISGEVACSRLTDLQTTALLPYKFHTKHRWISFHVVKWMCGIAGNCKRKRKLWGTRTPDKFAAYPCPVYGEHWNGRDQ